MERSTWGRLLQSTVVLVVGVPVAFFATPQGRDQWTVWTSSTVPRCHPDAARALARDPIFVSPPYPAEVSIAPSGTCTDVDGSDVFLADARYTFTGPAASVKRAYRVAAAEQGWVFASSAEEPCAIRMVGGHRQILSVVVVSPPPEAFYFVTLSVDDEPGHGC